MRQYLACIDLVNDELDQAFPTMWVTRRLEHDLRVPCGRICGPQNVLKTSQDIDAEICWMTSTPLRRRQKLAINHATRRA